MKVEVTATDVAEFKPIVVSIEVTIEDLQEYTDLLEDEGLFSSDVKLSDSEGTPYSPVTNTVVKKFLDSIVKPAKEEGKKA